MAEVTYYFNSYSSGDSFGYNNPANAVDNNLATFATSSDALGVLYLNGTNAPGTNLGTITKIELRAYGTNVDSLLLWGNWGYDLSLPASADWGGWSDVTVEYTDFSYFWAEFPSGVVESVYYEGGSCSIAKAELRVTYTASGGETGNPYYAYAQM